MTDWVKRHPFATLWIVILTVGVIMQIKHGPATRAERLHDCIEASKIGLASQEACYRINPAN